MSLFKIMTMEPGAERDKLMQERNIKIRDSSYYTDKTFNMNRKFDDEKIRTKRIKGDPSNIGRLEKHIEPEIIDFLTINDILNWPMKVKGEIQSTGRGTAVLKKSQNSGFSDVLCCILGLFVGIEVKKCGGIQSEDQIKTEEKIIRAGGVYFLTTSVYETIKGLIKHNLIKFPIKMRIDLIKPEILKLGEIIIIPVPFYNNKRKFV